MHHTHLLYRTNYWVVLQGRIASTPSPQSIRLSRQATSNQATAFLDSFAIMHGNLHVRGVAVRRAVLSRADVAFPGSLSLCLVPRWPWSRVQRASKTDVGVCLCLSIRSMDARRATIRDGKEGRPWTCTSIQRYPLAHLPQECRGTEMYCGTA